MAGLYTTSGDRIIGASELQAEFLYRGLWARQRSASICHEVGKALVEEVQRHASGRPGPEEVTGGYKDSMYYEVEDNGLTASVYAGSDEPFAMRLEYGYVGTDSLGRVYNQPPYPHWGPAADIVLPLFEAELVAMADFDIVVHGI